MLSACTPQREICAQLHIGRGVLNRYKKLADEAKIDYSTVGRMSEDQIRSLLQSPPALQPSDQKTELDELLPDYVEDLARHRHLTIQLLHEEYLKTHPDGYGYTQFKKHIRDYQYAHNLSYHNTYIPGGEMQIDFAGDKLYVTDHRTHTHASVVVLCCVLPFSGLAYAKAMYHASMEFFFSGLSDAVTYFGGSPEVCKSDNMVQWVKKSDRYEPTFNDAAIEWSSYYETSLEACRVRKPRDKGVVEGIVNKFYQYISGMKSSIRWMNSTTVFSNLQTSSTTAPHVLPGKAVGLYLKSRNGIVYGNFPGFPSASDTVKRSNSQAIIM